MWWTGSLESKLNTGDAKNNAFMPLEVVYDGQRCGFFADIECYTPTNMTPALVDGPPPLRGG